MRSSSGRGRMYRSAAAGQEDFPTGVGGRSSTDSTNTTTTSSSNERKKKKGGGERGGGRVAPVVSYSLELDRRSSSGSSSAANTNQDDDMMVLLDDPLRACPLSDNLLASPLTLPGGGVGGGSGDAKNHPTPRGSSTAGGGGISAFPPADCSTASATITTQHTAAAAAEEDASSVSMSSVMHNRKLIGTFLFFVIFGSLNAIFLKLQAVPMYNYPNFLNLWVCILYMALCFLYIIPAVYIGLIPRVQLSLPIKPFAIMGTFDCLAGLMQTFAAVYLDGPLLILLAQSGIPISMALSKCLLKSRYGVWEYVGAITVIGGILIVLGPVFTNKHSPEYVCLPAISIEKDCLLCMDETTEVGCLSHLLSRMGGGGDPQQQQGGGPSWMGLGADDVTDDASASSSSLWFATPDNDEEGDGLMESSWWAAAMTTTTTTTVSNSTPNTPEQQQQHLCTWTKSTHKNSGAATTLIWSSVMVLSCIPMALSSIYKERKLGGDTEIDAVYLNGWVAIFQTIYSLILYVPAGYLSQPPVPASMSLTNMMAGLKCYLGVNTIIGGCHPDDCSSSPAYVNTFLILNFAYSQFMILLLKFGSANIMFLALTVVVPIGNLAFAMPFMPNPSVLHDTDLTGLIVIVSGIVTYRFGSQLCGRVLLCRRHRGGHDDSDHAAAGRRRYYDGEQPMFKHEHQHHYDLLSEPLLLSSPSAVQRELGLQDHGPPQPQPSSLLPDDRDRDRDEGWHEEGGGRRGDDLNNGGGDEQGQNDDGLHHRHSVSSSPPPPGGGLV